MSGNLLLTGTFVTLFHTLSLMCNMRFLLGLLVALFGTEQTHFKAAYAFSF